MNKMKHPGLIAFAVGVLGAVMAQYGMRALAQQPEAHHEHFIKCAKACADCQVACDSCFAHCSALVAKGHKEHVKTMHTCVDCADCCALASKLSARQSPFAVSACDGCAKACDDCAKACENFKDDKHMADCAKSCRDCARECRTMIAHLKT